MIDSDRAATEQIAHALLALTQGRRSIAQDALRRAHEILADAEHEREALLRLIGPALLRPVSAEVPDPLVGFCREGK